MAIHPSARVHPAAIVDEGAVIGEGCAIGPFSTIGPEVTLGAGVEVKSHAIVTGWTEIGAGSQIFSFAVVGEIPQDLKYRGERTRLVVGERARIREGATLNTGTEHGGGITRVGDDCLIMTGAHVGHDSHVGDRVIMANQAALGGHAVIGDDVIIGGLSGVHQFVRIGRGAIIGAITMVAHDVMPFTLVHGPRGALDGLNLIGLKRRGVPREEIAALRAAYTALARDEGAFVESVARLSDQSTSPHVREMLAFVLAGSDRQFLRPR